MAQINSDIYFQDKGADVFGAITKGIDQGMQMSDMMNNRKLKQKEIEKQNKIAEVYKNSTIQNPDGTLSFDGKKASATLFGLGYGKEAFDTQDKTTADAFTKQKNENELQKSQYERVSKTANFFQGALKNIKDDSSYQQHLGMAKNMGLDISAMPPAWGPDADTKIKSYAGAAFTAQDRQAQENKDREFGLSQDKFGLDKKKFNLDTKKTEAEIADKKNVAVGGNEGRKALDKDYAKDFNDWTTTGRNSAIKNLTRLEEAKKALQTDTSLTGSFRGMTPDFIRNTTNESAILNRDKVRAAAQGALKATLGSVFTEKEGERIMNQAYNEKLSPKANIDLIDTAIKEIKSNLENADSKATYFQKRGTLNGHQINSAALTENETKPAWAK